MHEYIVPRGEKLNLARLQTKDSATDLKLYRCT